MADTLNAPPLLERIAPNQLPELKAYLERHRGDLLRMLASDGEAGFGLRCPPPEIFGGGLAGAFSPALFLMKQQKGRGPGLPPARGGLRGRGGGVEEEFGGPPPTP